MKNKNLAQFCDENGTTLMGSDSLIYFDGRWSQDTRDNKASAARERYRSGFPSLYAEMTHYAFNGVIRRVS